MSYTYGTNSVAETRLAAIADFFNPFSEQLIARYVKRPPAIAVDLGCGPGFTTDMLATATGSAKTYGLDTAEGFLASAAQRFPRHAFISHNVTDTPLPVCGQVIYARFLLAHLKDVAGQVNKWIGELAGGGVLILEELEHIETVVPVFNAYAGINKKLVASQGAHLYAGEVLKDTCFAAEVLCNQRLDLPVPNARAATWFYLMAQSVWEDDDFIQAEVSREKRSAIAAELKKIMESNNGACDSLWHMRQVVVKKKN